MPNQRRGPRLESSAVVLWCVDGDDFLQLDRLKDVSPRGALVLTESVAAIGSELHIELFDPDDRRVATGIARVVWADGATSMGIEFLEMGVNAQAVAGLGPQQAPPPLPGVEGGPPPLRLDRPPAADDGWDDVAMPQIEPLALPDSGAIIGIDLGTTNTCASYVIDGRPRIIPGRTGTNTIPSMVNIEPDGTHHVGQKAADRHVLQPLRTVYGSKRLLGRTYRSDIAAELQGRFSYPLGEAEGQRFGIAIDGGVVSMDQVAEWVLREVRSTAEAHLGHAVEAAVITVPAYFSEVQRDAVRRAAANANLAVHRVINEPTAAAVAYGHRRDDEGRIAVWDFGGGTFDFSIVDIARGGFEVVATGGDNFVGGSDFDDLVAAHFLGELRRHLGADFEPDAQQVARLRDAAEQAKRALSVQPTYEVRLPNISAAPRHDLELTLTRDEFNDLTGALVDRTVRLASGVMARAGIDPDDVDDVVLVGGTTRIRAVQQAVALLFHRRPSKRINPDEAVALGAALLAAEIGTPHAPTLLDILPMSVGRAVDGRRFEPIVRRNTRVPFVAVLTFEADLLGEVVVPLFQGEAEDVTANEYLCCVEVADEALWDDGRVRLQVSFDEHGVMAIEAFDDKTGLPLEVLLDRERPIDAVLSELGVYSGPPAETWRLPESAISKVLGKLFGVFKRKKKS